jgi:glycosyltransferase involved in cell wall biosynthesis
MDRHAYSVVIVSDYAPGKSDAWHGLRQMLTALATQDQGEAAEFIYVEHPDAAQSLPSDLRTILPRLRVVLDASPTSYGLRNAGVRAATTPWVAMLDADCLPGPGWLQQVSRIIRDNPGAAVISGRTRYPGNALMDRILALLSRSYVDRGGAGPTGFIAAHQCVFQRELYLQCPLPTGAGVYSARVQSDTMLRRHQLLWFDPLLACTHDFEGWPMERDIRRNTGHCTVLVRQYDPSLPYSGLVRLGPAAIPAIVAGKIWLNWLDCFRCAPHYGVRWVEVPLALAVAVWVHLLEIEGMWRAFRGLPITDTAYR